MGRKSRPDPRSSDPSVFYLFLKYQRFLEINDTKASLWLGLMDVISLFATKFTEF